MLCKKLLEHGKFKYKFWGISGIVSPNIFYASLVEPEDVEPHNYGGPNVKVFSYSIILRDLHLEIGH